MKIAKFNGGLGDLVLCLDHMKQYDKVYLKSHQDDSSIQALLMEVVEDLPFEVEIVDELPKQGVLLTSSKLYSDVIKKLIDRLAQ